MTKEKIDHKKVKKLHEEKKKAQEEGKIIHKEKSHEGTDS
jgi:hypothetical protein